VKFLQHDEVNKSTEMKDCYNLNTNFAALIGI